jgi:dimethylargininase
MDVAESQHAAYEAVLREAGCRVEQLPSDDTMPDAIFIEDTAVVLDEVAIITRPGAVRRRRETSDVVKAIERYRPVVRIDAPGTMDGGDVMVVGRRIFVGLTTRTNVFAVDAMRAVVEPMGYAVRGVAVRGCLHLKSAATALSDDAVLINPSWVEPHIFDGYDRVEVAISEPHAANVVAANGTLIAAAAFPRTSDLLDRRGFPVRTVDVSEIAKAEGAVTCCSLLLRLADA